MRNITLGVVHCAATPTHMDIGFKEIDQWHKERGWCSPSGIHCGYHRIIRRDGTIENGRPVEEMGAHAAGFNKESISWCLVGGRDGFDFTYEQLETLWNDMNFYKNIFPDIKYTGHNQLPAVKKACPQFDVKAWRYRA